jgi:hypothetical protein
MATAERRVLVTHNVADFAALASQWGRSGRAHAGLILARQAPLSWLLREVLRLLSERSTATAWQDQGAWAKPSPPRR